MRIAIIADEENAFRRDVMRGAFDRIHAAGHTAVLAGPAMADGHPSPAAVRLLPGEDCDGCVVQAAPSAELGALLAVAPAVVVLGERPPGYAGATVAPDEDAIGVLAAEHLLAVGCRRAVYAGFAAAEWSEQRRIAFSQHLRAAGVPCEAFACERAHCGGDWRERLPPWLRSRTPLGLFVQRDQDARDALAAIQAAGLSVPDEVAVLGVDDDQHLCSTVHPGLSSVALPAYGIGRRAVELLLAGTRSGDEHLPPLGVTARGSTDRSAHNDPVVAAALTVLRARWRDPIGVDDVARAAGVARRMLERRLRAALGRSPLEELRRRRLDHARQLLRETGLGLDAIAAACGFSTGNRLAQVFRQEHGVGPDAWRRQQRPG